MLIKKPVDISSSEITPKSTYLSRRAFIGGAVAAGAALAGGLYLRNHTGADTTVHAGGEKLSGIVKMPAQHFRSAYFFQRHHQLQQLLRIQHGQVRAQWPGERLPHAALDRRH